MALDIRLATMDDFDELMCLYDRLCQELGKQSFMPNGNRGGFPSRDMVATAIDNHQQFVGIEDGLIVAGYILNHDCDPAYRTVSWGVDAADGEFVTMHALRVLPEYSGRGYSKLFVEHAINTARQWHQRAVRLDVLDGNIVPEKIYLSFGFEYIDTVQITYQDIGEPMPFKLYEYEIIQ